MLWSRLLQGSFVICCLAVETSAGTPGSKKRRGDDESKKLPLPHHSFIAPLQYSTLLDDWVVSGASIFERERLLLHPGVPKVAGFAWNKWNLLTNDFEVIFHFRVSGEKDLSKVPADQGFAFWYAMENISDSFSQSAAVQAPSWSESLKSQGFTLLGSKAQFDGFGAMFSTADLGGNRRPLVAYVTNDGTKELSFGSDVPIPTTAKEIDFRNTLNPSQLKLRVTPDKIEAHLKQSPSLAWNLCFQAHRKVQAGGYIGFTAWSGSGESPVSSDIVSLVEVEVSNHDETSIGEDLKDVSAQIQDAYREMLTDEKRHFVDQKSQTEHLSRLHSMLDEYLNTSRPAEQKLFQQVQALTARMDSLSNDCRTLKQETHLLLGDAQSGVHNHKVGVEAMKSEIVGLRRVLVKDSATQRQKLEAVQKNVAEVKQKAEGRSSGESFNIINKQTEKLQKTVSSRGIHMSWMMIGMLISIVGVGGLMYNRMNYYEKKHFI